MKFEIKAVRNPGPVVALTLEASDEREARAQASAQGYAVLTLKARQSWRAWAGAGRGQFSLLLFSQELLSLMKAGLTVVDAIATLAEKEARSDAHKILRQIVANLYEGRSLSHALQEFPAVFPPLYVSTVRASEKTGDLAEALERYVAYQVQVDLLRKKVVSASIYPLLLVGAGGLITVFLLAYVVPRFSRIYEDIGTSLPLFSRLLLQWGKLLQSNGSLVLAVFVAAVAGFFYLVRQPAVRKWLVERLWQLPSIGERMRIYQLARFYRTLGMLVGSGIPLMPALEHVSGLLDARLQVRLAEARNHIREGQSLSQAMERSGLSTSVALRLLRVGERTGQPGEMMDRIADFHEEELNRWIDWASRLIEPLLMTVIGIVIGAIVVLMYLPIFELAGSIQ